MQHAAKILLSVLTVVATLIAIPANASDRYYNVTITNITRGQTFTPLLVASHKRNVDFFTLGEPASDEVAEVAEGGNIAPLEALLLSNSNTIDVANSGGLLFPGDSVMVQVRANRGAKFISVAAMLLPTNDSFVALNSVRVSGNHSRFVARAYDAGSEPNDESCANIPGPTCGGEPQSPDADDNDEGYVHISAGIHGIGDLGPEDHDWRNPVARIVVKRVHN